MTARAILADALHQAGRPEALACFRETEAMQKQLQPDYPLLYSGRGFRYCELLLSQAERGAWRRFQGLETGVPKSELGQACHEASQRAEQSLEWDRPFGRPIDVAFHYLTLGRAALYDLFLRADSPIRPGQKIDADEGAVWLTIDAQLAEALRGFHAGGDMAQVPRGYLTRAWSRFVKGDAEGARADLEEAQQVAERGPMRLHLADVHLHRARIFRDRAELQRARIFRDRAELQRARILIEQCGYGRRKGEFEDVEEAAGTW
jgi:hypothetical protein